MFEQKLEQLDVLCVSFIPNMTVYLNFYIFIYVITLVKVNYLLSHHIFLTNSSLSISSLIAYIIKFSKFKAIIFLLFLSLAGLPPFILFFAKFNYLINLLYKLNFFLIFLIFLIFFLNMLFYIQVFFHKNSSISLRFTKPLKKVSFSLYNTFFIVWYGAFIFFSIFFFSDLIFVFKLFVNGNI